MNIDPLVAALAVLGTAQPSLLNQLAQWDLPSGEAAQRLASLAVAAPDGSLRMAPDQAAVYLKALEAADFLHFRRLHERALELLSARLRAGDPTCEPAFRAVLIRLAERLLNQAPQELAALIEGVRTLPLSPPTRDYLLLFEAIACRNLERYADALARLDALLAQPDLAADVRGRAFNARGIAQFWLGQLQGALDSYAAALHIWQQVSDRVQEAMVRLNIGIVAYELHDYAQAESHLQTAAGLFEAAQATTWLPSVWNELGLVCRDEGRWQEALAHFERALAQRRAEGSEHRAGVILNNIGEVLLLQGELDAAQTALAQSLAQMTVHNVRVDALINLGLLHLAHGDLAGAEEQSRRALELAQAIDRRDIWPVLHYRLADVLQHTQTAAAALAHLRLGIEQIEAQRTHLRDEGLRISLLGRAQQLYELAVLLLLQERQTAEAFTLVERARARAFLDLLSAAEDAPARPATAAPEPATSTHPAAAAAIQAQLPAGSALVEFFATGSAGAHTALLANLGPGAHNLRQHLLPPERLFAFVVTPSEMHVVQLHAGLAQIEAQQFNRSDGRLRGIAPLAGQPLRPLTRWQHLGALLLRPLQPLLTGKRHLIFVPYGSLHYLPLHALLDPSELTGVARTTVSYAPSASILVKQTGTASPPPTAAKLLAVGVNGAGLQHAEAEAAWIAAHFDGVSLLGHAARRSVVQRMLPDFTVIHFSCHGHFRRRLPMDSALSLADGELTAASLLHSVRLQAEIVTLSACDTGLNHIAPSDELMGLTRALLGCGARSLLVTLWPVHETPTRLLMEHFYATWRKGATKAQALAAAQRYLAELTPAALYARLAEYGLAAAAANAAVDLFQHMLLGERPFAHPYYWAPFLLVGNPA